MNDEYIGFKRRDELKHTEYVSRRRTTLRRLILEKQYRTIGSITAALAHAGYAESQAVVGNDLKAIGAIKTLNENGVETWTTTTGTAIPTFANEDAITSEAMRAIRTGALTVTVYGNEVWIRATLATMRSITAWVSSLEWPEIGAVLEGLTDIVIKSWTHENAKYIRGRLLGVPEGSEATRDYVHAATVDIAGITEWSEDMRRYALDQNLAAIARRQPIPYPEFAEDANDYFNQKAAELVKEGLSISEPPKNVD